MTDRIDFGGEPWRAIPRSTLRDPRLSLKARGALTTLLSHDEGWVRSVLATLMHESTSGRSGAQAAMKELVQAGYATWERKQDPETGQFRTTYTVFAIPHVQGSFPADSPQTGNPSTDSPQTGNRAVVVEALEEETHDEEPKSLALASIDALTPNQRGNALAKVYSDRQPMSNFPAVAAIARKAIKAGHPDEEVAAALIRLAEEGRGVTTETLRVELEGLPERRTRQVDRAREILQEAFSDG